MRKLLIIIIIAIASLSLVSLDPTATHATTNFGAVVVQTIPGQTLAQQVADRAQSSWPWYLVRGAGIVAAISLTLLMLSGIGSITGHMFKFLEPITAWASHKALGIIFGISVLVHMVGLLFDHFVPFDIATLLVPWLSNYKPISLFGIQLGSLYIALGVIAFYLIAITILVSLVWIEKKPKLWKVTHLLSYIALLFVFIHALYLGTDLADGWPRLLWIATGIGIAVLGLYRLWVSRAISK
jgi:predicted ferric reductase